jgi:hypothetical protein
MDPAMNCRLVANSIVPFGCDFQMRLGRKWIIMADYGFLWQGHTVFSGFEWLERRFNTV